MVGHGHVGAAPRGRGERAGLELVDLLQPGRGAARASSPSGSAASRRRASRRRSSIRDVEGVAARRRRTTCTRSRRSRAPSAGGTSFVEKPIADSVEAGERMRRACAEAGVTLMVGHAFRRLGAARRVKRAARRRARSGDVVLAEANMSLPGSLQAGGVASRAGAQPGRPDHAARHPPRRHARRTGSARCGGRRAASRTCRPLPTSTTWAS